MKPEFKIDVFDSSNSPLEARTALAALDPQVGFHTSRNLRSPLGIYNISLSRLSDKIIRCCDRLERYFKTSTMIDVLRKKVDLQQEVIDYIELALYAAAEHVDDISLIVKGFFQDSKAYKSSDEASQVESVVKKHKTLISASINAIKHHQARIRLFSVKIRHAGIDHCLHGYFIEGVNDGIVGPNMIFNSNNFHVISTTSLIWEIICFTLNSSRALAKFIYRYSGATQKDNQAKEDIFTKAVVAAARLPIYSFDETHPFSTTRIIISADEHGHNLLNSGIYGSLTYRWLKSVDMEFFGTSENYEGDGVTKTFQIVNPKRLGLQHWD
ncbi:hypothetical protein SAMN04489760_13221 [Syntrophus gentianae]|uniref:Uncharacterized protein n=1 Tax=Syntrophus gentianae TaxID=43775 RepID=A0A1H8AB30_9BACT|nr:hypothetical protein [Syntrophus gentianae]SEM66999.1 hypothetical protein SAMN04489760_13221 [Syntrophus gentianae]